MEEKKDEEVLTEKNEVEKETSQTAECCDEKATVSEECTSCGDPLADALAKAKEFQDLYLRKAADFENYRKRMIREKQEAIDYANGRLISDLLPIMDNFDRALLSEVEEKKESIDAFVEGVNMIKGQLEGLLSRNYGLEYYKSKGETFDPNIHEAVAKALSKDVKVQTVGEEIQKGYKLKDRVLRHAKVLVLMPEAETENKETQTKN